MAKQNQVPEHKYDGAVMGTLRVMQALNRNEFGVELELMRDGVNRNGWDFQNIKELYKTFLGRPILTAYVGKKIGDGHNMTESVNPQTLEPRYSFTGATDERIVGTLSESVKDFTLTERDGHTWVVAKGKLFTFYAPEIVDKIVRTGRMDVSVEIESEVSTFDANGVEIITKWHGLGVTILGDDVAPAIPGARIAKLSAEDEEKFASLKLKAAALSVAQESQTKPEKNKGVSKKMTNKQTIARLEPLFPGYKILSLSEDEQTVCMMNGDCKAFTYHFNAEDNGTVVESRIKEASDVSVCWKDGETEMACDVQDVVSCARKNEQDYMNRINTLQADLNAANEKVSGLEATQMEYRKNAVIEAVDKAVAEIRKASIAEANEIKPDADAIKEHPETYACMVREGKFVGAEAVREKLMAKSAENRIAAAAREEKMRKNSFQWGDPHGKEDTDGFQAETLEFLSK